MVTPNDKWLPDKDEVRSSNLRAPTFNALRDNDLHKGLVLDVKRGMFRGYPEATRRENPFRPPAN